LFCHTHQQLCWSRVARGAYNNERTGWGGGGGVAVVPWGMDMPLCCV